MQTISPNVWSLSQCSQGLSSQLALVSAFVRPSAPFGTTCIRNETMGKRNHGPCSTYFLPAFLAALPAVSCSIDVPAALALFSCFFFFCSASVSLSAVLTISFLGPISSRLHETAARREREGARASQSERARVREERQAAWCGSVPCNHTTLVAKVPSRSSNNWGPGNPGNPGNWGSSLVRMQSIQSLRAPAMFGANWLLGR